MTTTAQFYQDMERRCAELKAAGLYKQERPIITAQGSVITTADKAAVINLCANNYLGLSSHPAVIAAAHEALDARGYGLSSVRFICGTQDIHKELEARLSRFLGTEDTILYSSAFDANGGLFETLFAAEDAIISDSLNHASIIDGVRLSKAKRYRYKNNDMKDLRQQLEVAREAGARHIIVFTDGVFSMDGTLARLPEVRALCDEFGALLGVDDSHATGFMGRSGRGTHEHYDMMGKVDIITGTLGKALGGASGGFTSAKASVVALLRQRSRPYLFSNSLASPIVGTTLKVLDLLEADTALRDTLMENTQFFRAGLEKLGFDIKPGEHPIIPVMVYDAVKSQDLANRLLQLGVYVTGFYYPVVPQGEARVRVQLNAGHSREQLEKALQAFATAGRELELVS
ncbi:MAG: 2-amino-3-ketobutyrate coenzyme A ligase [Candidatus Tokpelaia hoelldobleri]|uniref:2-amino-3-ketobutyrate coenzyme A ligase n=1 Tax=Candidatus Tokpelaia hoelldobleri TaxID=1902579 RepID=A0A1U9JT34_9HYPH|nr:MAG: 2-amino-3-ketobutyrate coenzyme A ligase [Candidatus Tokpelaia hoelldoblerii]